MNELNMDDILVNVDELTEEEIIAQAVKEAEYTIDTIKDFNGLKIELVGTWVWVSGNTKEHKENLKMLGFHWVPSKKQWFWKSSLVKYKAARPQSARRIRNKYGVQRTVIGSDPTPTED